MPFKSESQRRKFQHMVKSGQIPQHTYAEWEKATGNKVLPERASSGKEGPFGRGRTRAGKFGFGG